MMSTAGRLRGSASAPAPTSPGWVLPPAPPQPQGPPGDSGEPGRLIPFPTIPWKQMGRARRSLP